MSVFDGEIDFQSVYMVDFVKKNKPVSPRRHVTDDDCMLAIRDSLRPRTKPKPKHDIFCPIDHEYYKEAVTRIKEDHPRLVEKYMSNDLDPVPVEHAAQDLSRSEYLTRYCSRDLPFMSVNLARRARALQTLRLPDDVVIPDTSMRSSYRRSEPSRYRPPKENNLKPMFDDSLQRELRRILRINTGESTYQVVHGLLAKVVLKQQPFGPAREEPRYGRWRTPYLYSYYM